MNAVTAQAGAQFTVPGRPLPAGSKDRVPITTGNGQVVGHRIVETGDRNAKAAWRADIRHAAAAAMNGHSPLDGPVRLDAVFYLHRPKAHWRTGRHADQLRDSAPAYPVVAPDALKLTRGLEDALQGICFVNDSQIVDEHIAKRYGLPERTEVRVVPMFTADAPAGVAPPAGAEPLTSRRAG